MDSTLPVTIPTPYKSRRGWLIAFGVIEILMGCAFLLMILFSAVAFFGPAATRMPTSAMSPLALMVFVGLQYGLLAAVFFTGGVGSIRCKNWARILMLVVSGLWLGLGFFTALVLVFVLPTVMRQQPSNVPPGIQHAILAALIAFWAFIGVVLPAIFLFFYSRKSVRATCHAAKGAQADTSVAGGVPATGLPVPLIILGVWQTVGALCLLIFLFIKPMTMVFGVVVRGIAAILVFLTHSLLSAYSAWMIFRRKLIGWQIALILTSFWTISSLVTFLHHPDMMQLFQEMGYNSQTLSIYEQFPQMLPLIWMGTAVVMTILIAFILYTKQFFPKEEQGPGL